MEKPSALIIEDDREVAAILRHAMDLAGFRTEIILHGQMAVERLAHSRPEFVLLDLNLPGVSGTRLLEMIRKDTRLNHTKVVVVTGQAHVVGGLSVQPDLVLLKPVSIAQLTGLVKRMSFSEQSPKAVPLPNKPVDRLTGLYNQSFFMNRLESSLRRSRDMNQYLFAVFLFKPEPRNKPQNESGANEWESVLRQIAASLRSILRPTDTIARFDPDTFYMLIENVPDAKTLVVIANRLQERLYRSIPDVGNKIKIPIRIGFLLCDGSYEKVDLILSDARFAQDLAIAQGDEYAKSYYQVSKKHRAAE